MLSLRRQYIAFFAGIVFFLYEYILRVAPGVMTEDMERSFGIDASVFAVMNSMFFQTYLWMQIPVGLLLDTYKTGLLTA